MKLIFLTAPAYGHINPMLGIAKLLVEDGHEVIFYNTKEFSKKIKDIGAEFYPPPSFIKDVDFRVLSSAMKMAELSLDGTEAVIPYLEIAIRKEKPDCIIHDSFSLWGKIVAAKNKIPAISLVPSMAINIPVITFFARYLVRDYILMVKEPYRMKNIFDRFNSLYKKNGLAEIPFLFDIFSNKEDLNIVFTSSYLQPARRTFDKSFRFIGPVIYDRKEGSFSYKRSSKKPLIYISLGTIFNDKTSFYEKMIGIFGNKQYDVFMSIGKNLNIKALGKIPDNIKIKDHLPQIEVLKKADLFISHGGMNSVNESMYFGVPMIFYPQIQEQRINSRRIEQLEAGIYYKEKAVDTKRFVEIVDQVLKNKKYKKNAKKIGESLKKAGGAKKAKKLICDYLNS